MSCGFAFGEQKQKLNTNLVKQLKRITQGNCMNELKKIIYIDDQLDVRLMAEYALTEIGKYNVLTCESGAQALEKIEDFAPDLILVDLMMPGQNGTATISEIRKIASFKNTPVIFITAKIVPPEITELMTHDSAVIALIHKQFEPDEISQIIQSIWDSQAN